jgi:uncharacterized protein
MFLAISPTGDITSCQRLAGKSEFIMGNIFDNPTLALLYQSPAALRQREREQQVKAICSVCEHYAICKGGCYYNAIVSGDGVIDPLCRAYKEIYRFVRDNIMDEMESDDNISAVLTSPPEPGEHPLLRRGAYISLAGKAHPAHIADNARRILAIYELAKTNDPQTAAKNLFAAKLCGDQQVTAKMIERMQGELRNRRTSRNNCYIHVTLDCNLRCKHCYAEAGDRRGEMSTAHFETLVRQATGEKFRQIVVTGGEPLVHTERGTLLEICRRYRSKGVNLVLRTNLTGTFSDEALREIAIAFDQVVVSVDGNEQTHDERRGIGCYRNVVQNCERYAALAETTQTAGELSLACVMRATEINSEPGKSVRKLGERLGVRRVRFRPLLPLGRAAHMDEPMMCEGLLQHVPPEDLLKTPFHPLTTCGIGQNIFIKPDGSVHPCYAWCGEHTYIGNVFQNGLIAMLATPQFARLSAVSVNSIEKCQVCSYRYLCGGACRAWGNQNEINLNAAPPTCTHLQEHAQRLVDAAREYLDL